MSYISVGGMAANQMGMSIQNPSQIKPNQMVQNQINPKAFSAPQTIAGVYGQENPGTFTRSVNVPDMGTMDTPNPVPNNIQTAGMSSITPDQGFNNL